MGSPPQFPIVHGDVYMCVVLLSNSPNPKEKKWFNGATIPQERGVSFEWPDQLHGILLQ